MKRLLLIISLSILLNSCQKVNSYEGLSYEEICEEFDELAVQQTRLLGLVRAKFNDDKNFIKRFNEEQISWIQYQDKRLRALYSKDWDLHYRKTHGKEIFNGCKCKELIRLSKIRNADLQAYLDGPDASQQDCPVQGNE